MYSIPSDNNDTNYIPSKEKPHYIGSTKNCEKRLSSHINSTKKCTSLQILNEGGSICLEVLEKCDINERYINEQKWINYYRDQGYNVVNKNKALRTKEDYNNYMKIYMRNVRSKKNQEII